MRLQHAGLRVTDLERSLRFYEKGLGLTVAQRGDTRSWGGGVWVLLRDPRSGSRIELNWYPKGSLFWTRYRPGDGLDHLDVTLGVAPVTALDRAVARLVKWGGHRTRYQPATTGGWMGSVTDPDGHWVTLGRRPTAAERRSMTAGQPTSAQRRARARKRRRT